MNAEIADFGLCTKIRLSLWFINLQTWLMVALTSISFLSPDKTKTSPIASVKDVLNRPANPRSIPTKRPKVKHSKLCGLVNMIHYDSLFMLRFEQKIGEKRGKRNKTKAKLSSFTSLKLYVRNFSDNVIKFPNKFHFPIRSVFQVMIIKIFLITIKIYFIASQICNLKKGSLRS